MKEKSAFSFVVFWCGWVQWGTIVDEEFNYLKLLYFSPHSPHTSKFYLSAWVAFLPRNNIELYTSSLFLLIAWFGRLLTSSVLLHTPQCEIVKLCLSAVLFLFLFLKKNPLLSESFWKFEFRVVEILLLNLTVTKVDVTVLPPWVIILIS